MSYAWFLSLTKLPRFLAVSSYRIRALIIKLRQCVGKVRLMAEVLEIVFRSFWHFAGTVILLGGVTQLVLALGGTIAAIRCK